MILFYYFSGISSTPEKHEDKEVAEKKSPEKELPQKLEEIDEKISKKKPKSLKLLKMEHVAIKLDEAQFPKETEQPQFSKVKLKKPDIKPKKEQIVPIMPKVQLKSRIKFIRDWPPEDVKPIISFLNSVRQNGELSRNINEAVKLKKKKIKTPEISDLPGVELEKPEKLDYTKESAIPLVDEKVDEILPVVGKEIPEKKVNDVKLEKEKEPIKDDKIVPKKKSKLKAMTIEEKVIEIDKPQYAETVQEPQFKKIQLKKPVTKAKKESSVVKIPKVQLKSRIKFINDWPPEIISPNISFLAGIRQNGILSRNVKEAAKIKQKPLKQAVLPELEKTELEKPMFTQQDLIEMKKESLETKETEKEVQDTTEEEPEHITIKPRRPSLKKVEEIVDEITIKKKLKPVRKSSVTLPEITEPEEVTFRPKIIKTNEEVEQEFNIHLDSYEEEEISMSSKVKLKPQRQPTFNEEQNEVSIKVYEQKEDEDENIVEVIESDGEKEESTNIIMPLKKPAKPLEEVYEDITSNVVVSKPKYPQLDNEIQSEVIEDVTFELGNKTEYQIDDQEITFDIKKQKDDFKSEELSLSSKIKLASKKKISIAEASDETSIRLEKEVEEDGQIEEVIVSDSELEDKVEMVIKRKPKKPTYEVSEVEELSVELKPKRVDLTTFEEEKLTVSTKRIPKKPSQIQEAEASMSIAKEQEFPATPAAVRCGDAVFAVYSYVATSDDAISLVEGEKLYIMDTTNQDWWFVRKHLTEEEGWVPAQYLMDEATYTQYLQKKLNEKIDKLPVFEKPTSEEQAIAPIFVEKLRPKHTPDGSTVQFECQVEGYPRPQITWFRQTAIIKPSQDFQMYYDDDNVATLVIREVFPEDAGTFTCVAKNAAGFASSTTELIVEAPLSDHGSEMTILSRKSLSRESSLADILEGIPPTFSKRPKAQYVDEGSQIFLECRLVAIPEPDIVWFFKGEEVIPDDNVSVATESDMHMYCSVLKISDVKKYQEGTYTVLAVNREGEASLPIVLKIKTGEKEKPQVIEPLKSMTIREGDSVVLTAQVVGSPEPQVTWYRNNKPIKSLARKIDGNVHSITIIKPKKGVDDGVYSLKATNSEGSAETSAVITIEEPSEEDAEPPLFINRFQELTVKEKGVIRLNAKVTGNPVPTITWYRNNQIITPSDTVTQSFDGENIELVIKNVDSEIDSGDYKCVAANTAGKASHGARVTIDVEKVTFVRNLKKSYKVEEGKTVVLECETSHTVSTKWYHDGKELSGMDHREIIQESRIHKLRIKKSKLTDKGAIKCVVKDQETSTNLIVSETIPEFVRKLQDFEVKERDIAILEVEINSETADVMWEKDGEIIKPKKNKYEIEKRGNVRKLFIRNTSVHDEGEYTCKLRDDACTAEVTVVELPPEIITRLQDQRVNKGNKATFEIELTKGDALVRWFKDDSEIQFSNHIQLTIDGKKQKLKIYDCNENDEGVYACEVGNDKCVAKLIVEEPSIDFTIRLPEVIVVPANTDAYLTVEVPDESLTVTWYRRKTVAEDSEKFTLITDGKKRILIIRNCVEEDQCEYSCELEETRCTTKLKVEVTGFGPRILDCDTVYRVRKGVDVTLFVGYEASPMPHDEWSVDGTVLVKSKRKKPSVDSNSATLTIKKTELADAGSYKLILKNMYGEVEIVMEVVVMDIPSRPGKPKVLETHITSANVIWSEPEDTGNSSIKCYIFEYQEIDTDQWTSIENVKRTQYSVEHLKTGSSYRFRVFAVNEVGVSESSEVTEFIRIEETIERRAPTVERPLKDTTGAPNADIELTCVFGGVPEPKVSWTKNGKRLKTARATYVDRVAILAVTASASGEDLYTCVATNELGRAETSCKVKVQQKPQVTITSSERDGRLTVGDVWTVTADIVGVPRPTIRWYKDGAEFNESERVEIIVEESITVLTIRSLRRSDSGKYTVEATNEAGSDAADAALRVYDKPSKPSGPVLIREISRESVTIEWGPPLDDGGLDIIKYAVEKLEPETDEWVKVADVDRSIESYCIQKLNENREYMFRVMAQNPVGISEPLESESVIIKDSLDVPSPPRAPLLLSGSDRDSVTVSWQPPERTGGAPVLDYSLEICDEGAEWRLVATVPEPTGRVSGLRAHHSYRFRICARNEIGTSAPYEPEDGYTVGETLTCPSAPRDVTASGVTSRSVTLQWAPPESDGGSPITNYVLECRSGHERAWSKVVTVSGSTTLHRVENIRARDSLHFRVSAENAIGAGPPATCAPVTLERHATVPSPPTGPLSIRPASGGAHAAWSVPEWDGGSPLLGYTIAVRDLSKTMWMEVGKVDASTLRFNIRDLTEGRVYAVRIYARNEIGSSEPLESDEPFEVVPGEDSRLEETAGEVTEATEPSFSTEQTTTSWLRDHNMDADIRSYARGSLLRRDEYFFRIWHYAKQLFE